MRRAKKERKTKETEVAVSLNIDGTGKYKIDTSVNFLDHLLSLFSKHSLIDLEVSAKGDDQHHVVEDIGLVMGQTFAEALGDKRGITRYGCSSVPMDETLARTSVDLGGRGHARIDVCFQGYEIADLDIEMISHFLETFATEAKLNLHVKVFYGENDHHMAEALFKSLAVTMDTATTIDKRKKGVPSTKGVL